MWISAATLVGQGILGNLLNLSVPQGVTFLCGLEENKHVALLSKCSNDDSYCEVSSSHYFENLSFDCEEIILIT